MRHTTHNTRLHATAPTLDRQHTSTIPLAGWQHTAHNTHITYSSRHTHHTRATLRHTNIRQQHLISAAHQQLTAGAPHPTRHSSSQQHNKHDAQQLQYRQPSACRLLINAALPSASHAACCCYKSSNNAATCCCDHHPTATMTATATLS